MGYSSLLRGSFTFVPQVAKEVETFSPSAFWLIQSEFPSGVMFSTQRNLLPRSMGFGCPAQIPELVSYWWDEREAGGEFSTAKRVFLFSPQRWKVERMVAGRAKARPSEESSPGVLFVRSCLLWPGIQRWLQPGFPSISTPVPGTCRAVPRVRKKKAKQWQTSCAGLLDRFPASRFPCWETRASH